MYNPTTRLLTILELLQARRWIPAGYGTFEPVPEGVVFRCRYDDLDCLARYLVGLGMPFAVRQPDELKAALRRLADDVARLAA